MADGNYQLNGKSLWTGSDDDMAGRLAYAQLGMEHTDVMRRSRVDAMLPHMYAAWSRVRRGGKTSKAGPCSASVSFVPWNAPRCRRVVVLSTARWNWPELCPIEIDRTSGSRVFAYDDAEHWLLRGVDRECLKRWNRLPGTVAAASLAGPSLHHSKKILWVREPKHSVVAEIPAADGEGVVLFCQLDLRSHVLRSGAGYDPVAERIFVNIVSR